jgi:5S rRNA maturation endonuclease (ribonuclease M5)
MMTLNFENKNFNEAKALAARYDLFLLERLGFENITNEGVQCCCPIHGGDNPTAFSYDTNRNLWSCFTQKCHSQYGNDFIGLIRSVNSCSFLNAINWVMDNLNEDQIESFNRNKSIYGNSTDGGFFKPNKIISDEKLNNLSQDLTCLSDRNFNQETINLFQAGLCKSNKIMHQRIMIPIRNIDGQIVGFTGRTVHDFNSSSGGYHPDWFTPKEERGRFFSKWRTYPKNFSKSIELYNIDKAKKHIKETNACFIVEGPFDVWRLWESGIKNCVATLGTGLTNQQADLISESGCIYLYILYDQDKPGQKAASTIKKAHSNRFCVYNINLPLGSDPASLTAVELKEKIGVI